MVRLFANIIFRTDKNINTKQILPDFNST